MVTSVTSEETSMLSSVGAAASVKTSFRNVTMHEVDLVKDPDAQKMTNIGMIRYCLVYNIRAFNLTFWKMNFLS